MTLINEYFDNYFCTLLSDYFKTYYAVHLRFLIIELILRVTIYLVRICVHTPAAEQILYIYYSPEELKVQASLGEEEFVILLEPHLAHSSVLEEMKTKLNFIFMGSLNKVKH